MNCTNKQQETAECEKRGCEGCYYNQEVLKQKNYSFKFSKIGYGQGFYEGQMQERKYWIDKNIKDKNIKDKE